MDAAFLLSHNQRLDQQIQLAKQASAHSDGLLFRMTEGNSCFGGGKPGVSDAFASALWGADYMLTCALAGYCGVNLHGGGDGLYTPIAIGEIFRLSCDRSISACNSPNSSPGGNSGLHR